MRIAALAGCLFFGLVACGSSDSAPGRTDTAAATEWPAFEQAPQAPPTKFTTPLPRACELASAPEAEAVLAQVVTLMSDDPESCMWSSSAGVGRITMLLVQPSEQEDVAMAQSVFNAITGLTGNLATTVNKQIGEVTRKSGQELEDLGDEAWLSSASIGAGFGPHQLGTQQLVVRKGKRLLTLNVTGSSKTEGLATRLETLARTATPKL